ncbi:uracil-DNA glycosylase [Arenibaculum pallidiluteum]|uniref:uracil-DNA glycosylase n=1 Tax=Arenibaculum pallidiluteum TaxID=2812559 RepID=UPI001A96AE8D|nr:uracil-DNA glycosylase [Arenibaculum pallidiluteum]
MLPFVEYAQPSDARSEVRLAIIGEAPGAEEARLGKPFVGRSGRLLDENLEAIGIDRRACLVGNVFRYQPPGNKVDHFFASRARARKEGFGVAESWGPFGTNYVRAEFAPEMEHLRSVLERLRPAAIVALGRTPLWALTGENGIMKLRGQVLDCRLLPGAKVVPTFHPSYILRGQRAEEPLFRADIARAWSLAQG